MNKATQAWELIKLVGRSHPQVLAQVLGGPAAVAVCEAGLGYIAWVAPVAAALVAQRWSWSKETVEEGLLDHDYVGPLHFRDRARATIGR